jgi:hypothetical protein
MMERERLKQEQKAAEDKRRRAQIDGEVVQLLNEQMEQLRMLQVR